MSDIEKINCKKKTANLNFAQFTHTNGKLFVDQDFNLQDMKFTCLRPSDAASGLSPILSTTQQSKKDPNKHLYQGLYL